MVAQVLLSRCCAVLCCAVLCHGVLCCTMWFGVVWCGVVWWGGVGWGGMAWGWVGWGGMCLAVQLCCRELPRGGCHALSLPMSQFRVRCDHPSGMSTWCTCRHTLLLLCLALAPAACTDLRWTGGAPEDNNWETKENWEPPLVPGTADTGMHSPDPQAQPFPAVSTGITPRPLSTHRRRFWGVGSFPRATGLTALRLHQKFCTWAPALVSQCLLTFDVPTRCRPPTHPMPHPRIHPANASHHPPTSCLTDRRVLPERVGRGRAGRGPARAARTTDLH